MIIITIFNEEENIYLLTSAILKLLPKCTIYVIDDTKKKTFIATIADHLYKSAFVVDKEINAFACLVNLENALH